MCNIKDQDIMSADENILNLVMLSSQDPRPFHMQHWTYAVVSHSDLQLLLLLLLHIFFYFSAGIQVTWEHGVLPPLQLKIY